MPQYFFLGGFLLTVFFLQWWQMPIYPLWVWLVLLECIILFRKNKTILWSTIGVITACMAVSHTVHRASPQTVDWYATAQEVTLYGKIVNEPDKRPDQTKYTIGVTDIQTASGILLNTIQGNVLITDRRQWPEFQYGDPVIVSGTLEKPQPIETFRYDHYLSRYDIYSVIYRSSLRNNSDRPPAKFLPLRMMYSVKSRFEKQINRLYPEPHASFMAGLLTGSRKGIPDHLLEDFNITGLTHIIAISGYNITIIIAIISGALFWLPIKMRYVCSILAIIIFVLFVGASAAVVRAGIMGILGILAIHGGRSAPIRLSIIWTAVLMIAWNPKILWYDAGFQLSFLAVIGLSELSPFLDPLFKRIPQTLGLRESLTMTMAAQISAVPLIIMLFGRLSLIAPVANMLTAPVIPLAMLFGALGTVISFVFLPLGLCIAYGGWAMLEWIITIAHFCAQIPFASKALHMPLGIIITYYLLLILAIYIHTRSLFLVSKGQLSSPQDEVL